MTEFEKLRADFNRLADHTLTLAEHANSTKNGLEDFRTEFEKQIDDRFDALEKALTDRLDTFFTDLDKGMDGKLDKQLDYMKTEFFGTSDSSTNDTLDKVGDKISQLTTSTITGGTDSITISGKDSIIGGVGNDSIVTHDTVEGATSVIGTSETIETEPETGLDPSTGLPATK